MGQDCTNIRDYVTSNLIANALKTSDSVVCPEGQTACSSLSLVNALKRKTCQVHNLAYLRYLHVSERAECSRAGQVQFRNLHLRNRMSARCNRAGGFTFGALHTCITD